VLWETWAAIVSAKSEPTAVENVHVFLASNFIHNPPSSFVSSSFRACQIIM
jgi:hypothetical protein